MHYVLLPIDVVRGKTLNCPHRWGESDTPVGGGQGSEARPNIPGSEREVHGRRGSQECPGLPFLGRPSSGQDRGRLPIRLIDQFAVFSGTEKRSVARFLAFGKNTGCPLNSIPTLAMRPIVKLNGALPVSVLTAPFSPVA